MNNEEIDTMLIDAAAISAIIGAFGAIIGHSPIPAFTGSAITFLLACILVVRDEAKQRRYKKYMSEWERIENTRRKGV